MFDWGTMVGVWLCLSFISAVIVGIFVRDEKMPIFLGLMIRLNSITAFAVMIVLAILIARWELSVGRVS